MSVLDNRLFKAWIIKKEYDNYIKTLVYFIRFVQLVAAMALAVKSVYELDHLPFTLQYFKLIVRETAVSTGCTNTTETLCEINLDSCSLAALNTLEDDCKDEDVNLTTYLIR